MQKPKRLLAIRITFFLWIISMWFICWSFLRGYNSQSQYESGKKLLYGSVDGVNWEDREAGVFIESLSDFRKSGKGLATKELQEEDRLLQIDYFPISKAEVVREVIRLSSPKKLFLFQLERREAETGKKDTIQSFIETAYTPFMVEHYASAGEDWTTRVVIIGFFVSLILLLILAPILKSGIRERWLDLGLLTLALLLFSIWLLYSLMLWLQFPNISLALERMFSSVLISLLCIYSAWSLWVQVPYRRLAMMLSLSLLAFLLPVLSQLNGGQFVHYRGITSQYISVILAINIVFHLVFSFFKKWKGRSVGDKWFHIISLFVLLAYIPFSLLYRSINLLQGVTTITALFIFIPLANTTASQLKFGRVRLVLGRSLQYLLFSAVSLASYLLIHQAFMLFQLTVPYQNFLEVALLILMMVIISRIYLRNQAKWRNYFMLKPQRQMEVISKFEKKLPKYRKSTLLTDDFTKTLKSYFRATRVDWIPVGSTGFAGLLLQNKEKWTVLSLQKGGFWDRNKQLGVLTFEQRTESEIEASPYYLLFPVINQGKVEAFLGLGKKRRGVYNLSDTEIIISLLRQVKLSLQVIQLIEREQLLMEKSYEANLTALRAQINPHFLFNTLNTISALIHDAPDEAEKAVEKLAYIFRYTLQHSQETFVKLSDELSLVKTYLEIEQLRFGKRLQLSLEIDPVAENQLIPALIIQTLVENAIKHGISKIMSKGRILIRATYTNKNLLVVVEDNGPGIDLKKIRSSTGLTNALTRLKQIYEQDSLLTFEKINPGTKVTLTIPPYEKNESFNR